MKTLRYGFCSFAGRGHSRNLRGLLQIVSFAFETLVCLDFRSDCSLCFQNGRSWFSASAGGLYFVLHLLDVLLPCLDHLLCQIFKTYELSDAMTPFLQFFDRHAPGGFGDACCAVGRMESCQTFDDSRLDIFCLMVFRLGCLV